MNYKKSFLSVAIILSFLIAPFSVYANTVEKINNDSVTGHFELGPAKIVFEANQGEVIEREITVANHIGRKMGFQVSFEDFTGSVDADKGFEFVEDAEEEISAKNWLEPELKDFTLEHGERMRMKIKVNIPTDAILGEHQANVFVESNNLDEEKKENLNATVKITTRLGIPLLINVNGTNEGKKIETLKKGEFESFVADKKFYETGPVNFKATVKNVGNVHLEPVGYITIKRFGLVVDKVDISEWKVYRNSSRSQEIKWDKPFLIGPYEAEAVLLIDDNGVRKEFKKSANFTVIPYKTLGIVFVGLLILILFRRVALKRNIRAIEERLLKGLGKNEEEIEKITGKKKDKKQVVKKFLLTLFRKISSRRKKNAKILMFTLIGLLGLLSVKIYFDLAQTLKNKNEVIKQQITNDEKKAKEILGLKNELENAKESKETTSSESTDQEGAGDNQGESNIYKSTTKIVVLNGDGGLFTAKKFAETLGKLGYTNIIKIADADRFNYEGVEIRYGKNNKEEALALKADLESDYNVVLKELTSQEPAITIMVGLNKVKSD